MVDYSKWKSIEVSDDEDETHPNIDTPSLFRWRHQARIDRMEEMEKKKKDFTKKKESYAKRLSSVKEKLKNPSEKTDELQKELEKLEIEGKKIDREEEEMRLNEKKTPWNVDTISKPGFEKTLINKMPKRQSDEPLTEEEREQKMRDFINANEKLLKQYGMLRKYDDSKRFLQQHLHLVTENTANYLVVWSINLEMEGKHELMTHVAHQCICMQYALELAKQLDVDPRACVSSFFTKIQNCQPDYKAHFDDEIEAFIQRIEKRAQEKIREAIDEEEAERKSRLGPGGLDPAEVFEELPDELKVCFETRNIKLLHETVGKMPPDVAKYHIKRCIDSGLWVPNADEENAEGAAAAVDPTTVDGEREEPDGEEKPTKDEPLYTGVSKEDDLD